MTRAMMLLFAGIVVLFPRIAEACPQCVSKEPGGSWKIAALGVMIVLPFAITYFVVRTIRSSDEETDEETDQ